jgi:hypothetical protein
MLKLLKIGLPILLIGGLLVFKFAQPKPPLDIHSAATVITVNAVKLYAEFEANETVANATYVGKVIEVSGVLSAVEQDDTGGYILNLKADNPLGQITCNLAPNEKSPSLESAINQRLTVKGVCTGYLFDVVIDNATIIPQ